MSIYQSTEKMALMLGEHLAGRSKGLSRQDLMDELNLQVGDSTLIRWLNRAKELGLVSNTGVLKDTKWVASDELRAKKARELIRLPLGKRPLVTYNELWVEDYIPQKTFYLKESDLARMRSRTASGSSPISAMDAHDLSVFLCGLPYASSRMEGNSYSYLATVDLIERNLEMKNASKDETQMIMNHHLAVRYLIENINYPPRDSNVNVRACDIRTLHALLADNLIRNPYDAGKIRSTPVTIKDSAYKPLDVSESIESAFNHLLSIASKITCPFEQSFFLVVHLSYLQPFIDCNKRTARVACNIPLLRNGVAPMSWMDVDPESFTEGLMAVYEQNEVSLLAEMFADGYMRSIERFNILSHSVAPNEVVLKYGAEVRKMVRNIVMENDESVPDVVAECDIPAFLARVEFELEGSRALDRAILHRNGLKDGDILAWVGANESTLRHRMTG